MKTAKKENAVRQAIANSGLSGFVPTKFGMFMYAKWVSNECTANEAIALIIKYHKSLENTEPLSDGLASPNKLGITDKNRLKSAEADITTLRMAELY